MTNPPMQINYQKDECTVEKEQVILDEIFDVLFSFILDSDTTNKFEIVKGLTITSV